VCSREASPLLQVRYGVDAAVVRGRTVAELFEGGEVTAMATAVVFMNGVGMEVLLTVVSGEKVMLLLDSRKDAGGGRRKVYRCYHGGVAVNELAMVVQIYVLGNDVKVMALLWWCVFRQVVEVSRGGGTVAAGVGM